MEFPKAVIPRNDSKCTTASNLSAGHPQLEKYLHENCFEIPLQSTGSRSDGFNIGGSANFLNSDWFGQNLETNGCGGAWEIDDIEEQLEKFASQETTDAAAKLLQNSKEFDIDVSAAFELTGQTSNSAYDVFNLRSVDVVNSFENIREDLSHIATDGYGSDSVSGRIAVQSKMSEPCQAKSVESYCDQPSNCLTRNICLQFGTKEHLKHLQNAATGTFQNANLNAISNLPAKKRSSVEVDHCYCLSDNVRQNLRGGIDPILEQDMTDCIDFPVFYCADEADLLLNNGPDHQDELFPPLVVMSDAAVTEQCYIENSVDFNPCNADIFISNLTKEKDVLFELFRSSAAAVDIVASLPDVNELQDSTLIRNSSVPEDQRPVYQSYIVTDSLNCDSSSVQDRGVENLLQNSTIPDPHCVRPSMLLQSANVVAKECLPIIYCPEDVTEPLSRENWRENETLKVLGADDRPTDENMPDPRIDDVVKNIKKEKPFLFGDKNSAEDGVWKDPDPYGLKECYCPHGYVSSNAGHFHCQECGSSTRHKHSMVRHEILQHRVRHPNIKVLSCPHCSACFFHSSRLKRHILQHRKRARHDSKDDNVTIPPDFEHQKSECSLLSTTANNGCDEMFRSTTTEGKNVQEAFHGSKLLKRKSDERSSNFKKVKPAASSEDKSDGNGISLPKEYSLITLIAEEMSTTCRPAYDGPLLPVLLTPTKICKFCGRRFSKEDVQLRHYARVHQFGIGGMTVYQCALCKYRTICDSDFQRHIKTSKHRSSIGNKSEHNVTSGEIPLTDDVTKSIRYDIKKKKYGRSNFKNIIKAKYMPKPSRSYRAPRSNDRKASIDNCSKSCPVVKNGTGLDLDAAISKYSSNRKISQFFSLMKHTVDSTDKFADSLSSEIVKLNACVSGHGCTLRCICSSNVQGDYSSNVKMQCHNPSMVSADLVNDNKTVQRPTLASFGNKGIRQRQDDGSNLRSGSTKPMPITFYQDTSKRFQTPTLAQRSNPASTKGDAVPLKSGLPVVSKRKLCSRKPCLTANKDSCSQTLDDGSETSSVPAVKTDTLDTVGQFKAGAKQTMARSSHGLLDPCPGNQMVIGNVGDVISLDDDEGDDGFVAKDRSGSTVHVSSKSDDVDGACFSRGASSLSGFSDEELFSELKKRSSLMLCCCGVYFLDSNVYSLHCAWHSEEGSLKCNFCGLNSKNWYEFYSHVLNHSK